MQLMNRFIFMVHGQPKTAGSKKHIGGGRIIDTSGKAGAQWRKKVAHAGKATMQGLGLPVQEGPISLEVTFFMKRPKHHFTKSGNGVIKTQAPYAHTIRPDATKLLRAVEDALTGVIWKDDAQIYFQAVHKVWATQILHDADASSAEITVMIMRETPELN